MSLYWRNTERTYTACPVLNDSSVRAYLRSGELPVSHHWMEVPATKIIRSRGFWLKPSYRCHPDAAVFLISTDTYEMNVDELALVRSRVDCFFSDRSSIHYLGRITSEEGGALVLVPLIADLHEPLPLDTLRHVGRVIAAA